MSAAQWFATAAVAHGGGHKKHTPGTIKCSWPIEVVSRHREFDLTECFELAILQPVPLILSILVGLAQIAYRTRKLRQTGPDSLDWITRSARNEKVAKTKVVSSVVRLEMPEAFARSVLGLTNLARLSSASRPSLRPLRPVWQHPCSPRHHGHSSTMRSWPSLT